MVFHILSYECNKHLNQDRNRLDAFSLYLLRTRFLIGSEIRYKIRYIISQAFVSQFSALDTNRIVGCSFRFRAVSLKLVLIAASSKRNDGVRSMVEHNVTHANAGLGEAAKSSFSLSYLENVSWFVHRMGKPQQCTVSWI